MAFQPNALLRRAIQRTEQSYNARDVILYALGVGVGIDAPTDAQELQYVYERSLTPLPSMALVLAAPPFWLDDPAVGMTWKKVLNAGQEVILHAPLPQAADVYTDLKIDALWDKGAQKGALMESIRQVRTKDGVLLAEIKQVHILRGDGGFGGPEQPAQPAAPWPTRAPDYRVDLPTRPEQALLYRLSGDYNPLHIDPQVAQSGGFPKPILHGACTFGIACRAVLRGPAQNDAARLKRFGARYSRPVFPGDTIRTDIWVDGGGFRFRSTALERNETVLDQGFGELREPL